MTAPASIPPEALDPGRGITWVPDGGYRLSRFRYERGRLAWLFLMAWPARWFFSVPARVHGWAWSYAEDDRQPRLSPPRGQS